MVELDPEGVVVAKAAAVAPPVEVKKEEPKKGRKAKDTVGRSF